MASEGVPIPGKYLPGDEPAEWPDEETVEPRPQRLALPPPAPVEPQSPVVPPSVGFFDQLKGWIGRVLGSPKPQGGSPQEAVLEVSTTVVSKVADTLAAANDLEAPQPLPPPPPPAQVAPQPPDPLPAAPDTGAKKIEKPIEFTENEQAVLANEEIPAEVRAIYEAKVVNSKMRSKGNGKDRVEALAEDTRIVEGFERIEEVLEELSRVYEDLAKQAVPPSPEWMEEAKGYLAGLKWASMTKRFLGDISQLKKSASLSKGEGMVEDWRSRGLLLSMDGEFVDQRIAEDCLIPAIKMLQVFFEAHKIEMPSIAAKLNEIEARVFPEGIKGFIDNMATAVNYRHVKIDLYKSSLVDLGLRRNMGLSSGKWGDLPREAKSVPENLRFPITANGKPSPVVYRITVPLLVPLDPNEQFAPGSFTLTSNEG